MLALVKYKISSVRDKNTLQLIMGGLMNTDKKRVNESGQAYKGSQRHIQTYVNQHAEKLNEQILKSFSSLELLNPKIIWVSPLKEKGYKEYQDEEFLEAIGLEHLHNQLKNFWPKGGPVWDALATVEIVGNSTCKEVILVEAKSHPEEIKSNCSAISSKSIDMINKSLEETKRCLGVDECIDWTKNYYQMVNRIAHLCFFHKECIPAWLVNLYFINDIKHKPTTLEEWKETLANVKKVLGISNIKIPNTADIFLPAIVE